ncbi:MULTISPECIES: hypothetical protein [Clostridia]|uniref:hypothetical protein n=1 Tax=Clostridia TaxID=186801 RepID=UPI0018F4652F|nr:MULTISPECIES: hypothetical protein [Clostridia]
MYSYNNHYDPSLDDHRVFPFSTLENVAFGPGQAGEGFGFPGPPPAVPGSGGLPNFPGSGGVSPGFPTAPGSGGVSPGFPAAPGSGGVSPGFPAAPGSGGGGQPPSAPPPAFTPQKSQVQAFTIDPGGIRACLFRYTYIWLRRDAFWFYPTFVGRNSIAGFRWTGFNWVYFGIDLNRIQSFQCF